MRRKIADLPPPKHGIKLDPDSTVWLRLVASFLSFAEFVTLILILYLCNDRNLTLILTQQITNYTFTSSVFDLLTISLIRVVLVWLQACDNTFSNFGKLNLYFGLLEVVFVIVKVVTCHAIIATNPMIRAFMIVLSISSLLQVYFSVRVMQKVAKHNTATRAGTTVQQHQGSNREHLLNTVTAHETETKTGNPTDATKATKATPATPATPATHASLGRLLALAGPEKWLLICGTVALFFSSGATMIVPALFGALIRVISTNTTASPQDIERSQSELNRVTMLLVIFFGITSIFTFLRGSLFTLAGERLVARFRKRLFESLTRADISFFDKTQSGELVNRLASDSAVIQNAVTVNISMALRFVAQFVVGLILLFVLSPSLTGIMLASVPAVVCGAVAYGSFVRKIGKAYQKALASAGEVASEVLGNVRTVRSFGKESSELYRYSKCIDDSFYHGKRRAFAYGAFAGGIGLFAYSAVALVLWYGGTLVIQHKGGMDSGTLVTFLLYTIYIAGALGGLSSLYGNLLNAVGASERMFELLDMVPTINTAPGSGIIPTSKEGLACNISRIEFRQVCFSYPTRKDVKVLEDISFVCKEGQTIALVGSSGAGKSTVVSLIQRFYDPELGQILLGEDQHPLNTIDPVWLKSKMALVAQEPVLFACSIRDNIVYGAEIRLAGGEVEQTFTEEQVIAAAKQANAHDFIMEFKDGYNTQVGERGVQLSGGQK